jgi:hypothetical protein
MTTTAKKYYVAKRYQEADLIFNAVNENFNDIYRSIDLYFWASSLAYLGDKEKAFEKILMAQKRQNDCWSIEYKVNKDSVFSFLTEDQLLKISNTHPVYNDIPNGDSLLYDTIIELHAYDSYIREYIDDSLFVYEKGTQERERIQNHIFDMNREVSHRFYMLIRKHGFPKGCYLMGLCELFLIHLDDGYWDRFDPILKTNLKHGKITPFIYSYTYFRTHKLDDKYGSQQYPEFQGAGPLLIEKNKITEKASKGLGL